MKERPILFSAPMARALLAGTKTQTRRVVKGAPNDWTPEQPQVFSPAVVDRRGDEQPGPDSYGAGNEDGDCWITCPYGRPGDLLWVREAWRYRCSSGTSERGQFMHNVRFRADGADRIAGPMPLDGVGLPKQRDRRPGETFAQWDDYLTRYWRQWRPSIHMPRWASRITLELTAVRVERLQDISEADALAEGGTEALAGWWTHEGLQWNDPGPNDKFGGTAIDSYRVLWESINGPGSWAVNPWVWCIEFKIAP